MTDKAEKNNNSSLSEAEKFLESLNLPDAQAQETDGTAMTETDSKDIMSFLDEISNYPTEDAKQEPSKQVEEPVKKVEEQKKAEQPVNDGGWKSWGNSFWNQASAAVKNTTDQINRSVGSDSASKLLESRVKTLQSLVNKENIEKLSKYFLLYLLKGLSNTCID